MISNILCTVAVQVTVEVMVTIEIGLDKKIVVVEKGAAKEININTTAGEGDPDLGPIKDMKGRKEIEFKEETEGIEGIEGIEVIEGIEGIEVIELIGVKEEEIEMKGAIEVVTDISVTNDTIGQIDIEDKVEATQGIVIKN